MKNNDPNTYRILRAEEKDCLLIRELASKVWEPTYGKILSPEQLDYMFEWMYSTRSLRQQMQSGHTFFIVYSGQEAVGYMSIEKETENRYHLQKIYILPEMQRKGLGQILIEFAERHIRGKHPEGTLYIALNVNRNNKSFHFYERLGFSIESQGDFDIGNGFLMNDYIMVKEVRG